MRTITLLFSALVLGTTAPAQTVATFDDLSLTGTDTFYVNMSNLGNEVGFTDGKARFPCIYDTSGGYTFWNYFAYSNMTDSTTSGFGNQYAAKTGIGYNGSAKYAVAYCANPANYLDNTTWLNLTGAAIGRPVLGFYVTNSTYAYNDMRDGTPGVSKKFGGVTGNDPDWFLLTVYGYLHGVRSADSVNYYLADYRFAHNDSDYIVKTWNWLDLGYLGNVDSLVFHLSSSDTGTYGMNTPAYFCMDNFTTDDNLSVKGIPTPSAVKIYPNPATDMLYVEVADNSVQQIAVADVTGKVIANYTVTQKQTAINTSSLPAGMYVLQLAGNGKTASAKFIKK